MKWKSLTGPPSGSVPFYARPCLGLIRTCMFYSTYIPPGIIYNTRLTGFTMCREAGELPS
jgi:hypothetical protein